MEFSDHLAYLLGMAPRSEKQASLENGGIQVSTDYFLVEFLPLQMNL